MSIITATVSFKFKRSIQSVLGCCENAWFYFWIVDMYRNDWQKQYRLLTHFTHSSGYLSSTCFLHAGTLLLQLQHLLFCIWAKKRLHNRIKYWRCCQNVEILNTMQLGIEMTNNRLPFEFLYFINYMNRAMWTKQSTPC